MTDRINHCYTNHRHPIVDTVARRKFCPERLIQIDRDATKLVLRDDILRAQDDKFETPKYMALSYCWGSAADARQQLKTDSASIAARLNGIHEDEMTNVLKDAVTVA